jgi:choline dehydrogenase
MPHRVTRRAFLAAAAAVAPAVRLTARQPPETADVVIIGGDPGGYAAAWRLAQTPGLRIVLVDDAPAWAPAAPPLPALVGDVPPFVRGHQVCFDHWRDQGNDGWGYADVLPSFKRLERYEAGANEFRGADGPLSVMHCWDPHPAHRTFLLACVGGGGFAQDSRHDFNGPRSQSVGGYFQKAIRDDRAYAFDAALLDGLAPGAVTRVRGAAVTRVVFDRRRAAGVELAGDGSTRTIRAARAVIVASTPVRAAQLLMLSGVGPADHLRSLGVPVVADRPGVGRNLHDQVRVPLRWQGLPPVANLPASTVTAGLFTVSLVASPPDLQIDFVDPRVAGALQIGFDITAVQPTSRGEVRLRSASQADAPLVSLNVLATEADVTALVQGVRLARLIGTSPQLDRLRSDEVGASRGAISTPDLQAYVRGAVALRGHLAGTCAMGPSSAPEAVVGARLAVHGVDDLYVVGASVMPTVVNAPPDAAALMIGDRGGEFVAASRPA